MHDLCIDNNSRLTISGIIILHRRISDARTPVVFGVVEHVLVARLLCARFIDRFIKSKSRWERKPVLYNSPAVSILNGYESEINSKNAPSQDNIEEHY